MNTDKMKMSPGKAVTVTGVLGSLRFALAVVLLITAACVTGTLLPQGYQVGKYLEHHPDAQRRMEILDTLGLTHVFFSWWFVALLCVLAASLSVCTFRRFQALQGAVGSRRLRVLGSLFTHVSLLLVLSGGVIRAIWGQTGYIEFHEGQTVSHFAGNDGPATLPFAVRLIKFELQMYGPQPAADRLIVSWPAKNLTKVFPAVVNASYTVAAPDGTAAESCRVSIKRYLPDFCINNVTHEKMSRSEEPNNPALLVDVAYAGTNDEQWIFARFPDFAQHDGAVAGVSPLQLRYEPGMAASSRMGAVKAYKSTLQILVHDQVMCEKTIAVNTPLSYGGYTFYQSGYNPQDLTWTSLQVVRDPGVMVVYLGFVLIMVGLTMVFWVAPMAETGKR